MMLNQQQISDFLQREFPQVSVRVDSASAGEACLYQEIDERHLRPGGTVSGPTMMMLADCAAYVAILSQIGLVALAVTTNLSINFLRKPAASRNVFAQASVLKMGKRLAVVEIKIFSQGQAEMVAHATATYSIPPISK